jgi:glycerol-3-phosphate dehydrogenase
MSHLPSSSERIVIVGGGFAGLSAAARLARAGLPVTVLEASKLGYAASTQNQGWLYSGAWFARQHRELARLCYASLQQTIAFCPDCLEPGWGGMVYLSLSNESDLDAWTAAWDEAGIPYQRMRAGELNWNLPRVSRDKISWTMRLPDRSFRPDVLLSQLAATARNAGAEICPDTFVTDLLTEDRRAYGVTVGTGEEIHAQLVILATGAYSQHAFSELFRPVAGHQSDYQLVCLKSHLRAIRPGLAADPFCIVDGMGLNHLPHYGTSVFGTSRWEVVPEADNTEVDPRDVAMLERELALLFPEGLGRDREVTDWAGTTVQAMHVEQIDPGTAPLPTIVDHAREPCGIENVLSIFPGRATLWAPLAESVCTTVLERIGSRLTEMSRPPWAIRG